ncbi:MAG TPA: prolipoprotein diacylglyceryl transferase family protein, partial [Actinomycetota bacterium]|nr:prolipoprotein diacylglyceryl transferase family protein [Actinomycetota bacterium]
MVILKSRDEVATMRRAGRVVAGFLGGRLGYVITHTGDFRDNPLAVFAIWQGGLALYGGLTVGILTGLWVARRRGLPVLRALDAAIPAIP